ncbi:MAG: PIG-L family deacetylase, partial [Anaerolineales bacterium]
MNNSKKILSVLAHPDDESFGMGGTLAYYASEGVEVHLICATRGEAGMVDPEF